MSPEPCISERVAFRAALLTVAFLTIAAVPAPAFAARPSTEAQVEELSLREQLGLRVIASYPGPTPPPALLEQIADGEVGGVIFFGANVTSNAQIRQVTSTLQKARKRGPNPQPLLLMTDQEGGLVRRIPGDPFLSAKAMGDARNPRRTARAAGRGAGATLAAAGVNLNLAPVLGVYREPGNFLDRFGRSFSMDPFVVSDLGAQFIGAQQQRGVAATSKHFPGLGAAPASADTDAGPVTIDLSRRELRAVDELPYPAAISAGTRLVMLSWALYPALDPNYPAGLSRRIVKDELRDRLGFEGLTITDALEAGALTAFGATGERSVLAAKAGMDVLLFSSRDPSQAADGLDGLVEAVRSGRLSRERVENTAERILELRDDLRVTPGPPLPNP